MSDDLNELLHELHESCPHRLDAAIRKAMHERRRGECVFCEAADELERQATEIARLTSEVEGLYRREALR